MMEGALPRRQVIRVLAIKPLTLLLFTMAVMCHKALLQMVLQSVLEKVVALLNATLLHVSTVHSVHPLDPFNMAEETLKGIEIGTQGFMSPDL